MNAPPPTMQPSDQVRAARGAVLAVVEPGLAAIRVTGKDRVTWLNGLVTCDLMKRAESEARYGLIVVRSGKVLVDLTVVLEGDAAYLVVPAGLLVPLREHLDHYLVMEDAEMTPEFPAEVVSLHGPASAAVLAAARAAGAAGGVIDRTGLGGAIVVLATGDGARADAIRTAMTSSLSAAGGGWGDASGWEALRLERNVPRFGVDFDDKMYPQEAALEKTAVSFDKGCYLGQEVVCMLEMRGHVKRKLVSLIVEGQGLPERGSPVTDAAGAAIGELTSAADSPTLSRVVALAVLKRAHTEPGTRVVVAGRSAEVVQRPA
ncbi:MAG: YgfZ/GcvT domain-containing protein [Polyangiaceae bacterium]